jgi:hypothetical protein
VTTIDARAAQKIQSKLMSGENIYWAGMPNPAVIFHSDDWALIPLSLAWTGFFVFWEAQAFGFWSQTFRANGNDVFVQLWGIPFLLAGNYMVWGRFLFDACAKRRTYYAVTNRRVLVLQEAWKKKTSMTFLEAIPQIEREGSAIGTLWFGVKYPVFAPKRRETRSMSRFSIGDVPVFADIEDVDAVHRLIIELREQTSPRSTSVRSKAIQLVINAPTWQVNSNKIEIAVQFLYHCGLACETSRSCR